MNTEQKFDLEAVLSNSEAIQKDFAHFDTRMAQLQEFEGNIFHINGSLANTIPFYDDGRYGLKVVGTPLSLTKKSTNDFFQKAKSDVKIQHFYALKDLVGMDGEKMGIDLLHAVSKHTKRDELKTASRDHKFLGHNGNLLGIVSPSYPSRDVTNFSFYKLLEATRDTIALNSKNIMKTELRFNPLSGSVKSRIFFDTMNGETDKGWGITLQSNYAGGGSTRGGIAQIDWLCTNGQMRLNSKSSFSLVNSSEKNIFKGLTEYFNKHSSYWELGDEQQVIFDLIEGGEYSRVFGNMERETMFYEIMAKTFVTAVNMEKSRYERAIIRARETSVDNIVEEYKKLRAKYSNILTMSDVEKLLIITDQDPTIDIDEASQYTVVQAVTRLANDPTISSQRSERLQELGDEILLTVTH